MSNQFDLQNEITSLCKQMEGPLKGPVARWQRKAGNTSTAGNNMSMGNKSSSNSYMHTSRTGRSPLHDCTKSFFETSQNLSDKQNSRGSKNKSSGKSQSFIEQQKTGQKGDRFIPSRVHSNLDTAWHKLNDKSSSNSESTLAEDDYRRRMKENLDQVMGVKDDDRILAYNNRPTAVEGYQNKTKVLYSSTKKVNVDSKKNSRHIPSAAEKVLDAPELMDDFYMHVLDWGQKNLLAVGLNASVYLWNASSGEINKLMDMENENDYVSSIKWSEDGDYLAIGDSQSCVQLWDVAEGKRLRNMRGHTGRINTMSWNKHILTSGSTDSEIHNHDVRVADHHVGTLTGHSQVVCGVEWSADGNFLASGGNDNVVNVYDNRQTTPLHTFTEHQAAVKALAWCPWEKNVLATGGGSADRHIRLWNVNTGVCNKAVDTKSQVCMLKWSSHYKELLSSHGYAQYQLTLWSFPSMAWIKDLHGHTARVLYLTVSPDGQTVCSAAADETLRLWKCFQVDPTAKKKPKGFQSGGRSLFNSAVIR